MNESILRRSLFEWGHVQRGQVGVDAREDHPTRGFVTIGVELFADQPSTGSCHVRWQVRVKCRQFGQLRDDLDFRAAEAQLKVMCGAAPGIEGLCTWSRRENTGLSFDKGALKGQQPELYADYEKPATTSESHVLAKDSGYRSYP